MNFSHNVYKLQLRLSNKEWKNKDKDPRKPMKSTWPNFSDGSDGDFPALEIQ